MTKRKPRHTQSKGLSFLSLCRIIVICVTTQYCHTDGSSIRIHIDLDERALESGEGRLNLHRTGYTTGSRALDHEDLAPTVTFENVSPGDYMVVLPPRAGKFPYYGEVEMTVAEENSHYEMALPVEKLDKLSAMGEIRLSRDAQASPEDFFLSLSDTSGGDTFGRGGLANANGRVELEFFAGREYEVTLGANNWHPYDSKWLVHRRSDTILYRSSNMILTSKQLLQGSAVFKIYPSRLHASVEVQGDCSAQRMQMITQNVRVISAEKDKTFRGRVEWQGPVEFRDLPDGTYRIVFRHGIIINGKPVTLNKNPTFEVPGDVEHFQLKAVPAEKIPIRVKITDQTGNPIPNTVARFYQKGGGSYRAEPNKNGIATLQVYPWEGLLKASGRRYKRKEKRVAVSRNDLYTFTLEKTPPPKRLTINVRDENEKRVRFWIVTDHREEPIYGKTFGSLELLEQDLEKETFENMYLLPYSPCRAGIRFDLAAEPWKGHRKVRMTIPASDNRIRIATQPLISKANGHAPASPKKPTAWGAVYRLHKEEEIWHLAALGCRTFPALKLRLPPGTYVLMLASEHLRQIHKMGVFEVPCRDSDWLELAPPWDAFKTPFRTSKTGIVTISTKDLPPPDASPEDSSGK